jgi:hypothetical protein
VKRCDVEASSTVRYPLRPSETVIRFSNEFAATPTVENEVPVTQLVDAGHPFRGGVVAFRPPPERRKDDTTR